MGPRGVRLPGAVSSLPRQRDGTVLPTPSDVAADLLDAVAFVWRHAGDGVAALRWFAPEPGQLTPQECSRLGGCADSICMRQWVALFNNSFALQLRSPCRVA